MVALVLSLVVLGACAMAPASGPIFLHCLEDDMAALEDLTPREMEVLQLVLSGRTNKAIAAELSVSEKTVEFHLDRIYSKTGRRTRLLVGVWAIRLGLRVQDGTREIPS
jgi:DNA-binding NarL/FixJ family response regulator